ncbi:MAG: glycosyltransferase 61 family protein [Pseudomonadota bacterium]
MFTETGDPVEESICLRAPNLPATVMPETQPEGVLPVLPGRWLFGGLLYAHFGHLICESVGRLWPLDANADFDGILFLPKKRFGWENKHFSRAVRGLFSALGLGDLALRAPQNPVAVEELHFPEQAFGTGEMCAARPELRAFLRDRLRLGAAPDGPRRIYISRQKLYSKRGSLVLEDELAQQLAGEGYVAVHPQELALTEQAALYRAAGQIISTDCSALHLAAIVAEPHCEVAILQRAPTPHIHDFRRQFNAFAGIEPLILDAMTGFWSLAGGRIVKREVFSEVDFDRLSEGLSAANFITRGSLRAPDANATTAAVARIEAALGPLDYHSLEMLGD